MNSKLDTHLKAYTGDNLYDFDNEILLTWYPHRIIKHCHGARSLLELGLGHGYTTNIFSQYFDRHLVIDGSQAVIKNFEEKYPNCKAQIVESYFEALDIDEQFDVIVMGFILEHVDNPHEIISRYKRYLSPGGKIFIAVPNAGVLNRRLGVIAGMLEDMTALSENDHLLGHQRYYTVETLSSDIMSAGYKIDKLEGIYLKPFTTTQMLSLDLNDEVITGLCTVGIDYPELSCGILAEISIC